MASADGFLGIANDLFIESFFAPPRKREVDELLEYVRANPEKAAAEIRQLRRENMRLAVDSAELSWIKNPDRMGK